MRVPHAYFLLLRLAEEELRSREMSAQTVSTARAAYYYGGEARAWSLDVAHCGLQIA